MLATHVRISKLSPRAQVQFHTKYPFFNSQSDCSFTFSYLQFFCKLYTFLQDSVVLQFFILHFIRQQLTASFSLLAGNGPKFILVLRFGYESFLEGILALWFVIFFYLRSPFVPLPIQKAIWGFETIHRSPWWYYYRDLFSFVLVGFVQQVKKGFFCPCEVF